MEFFEHLDRSLIVFLNGLNSPFFDGFFYNISKPLTGLPIYIYVIFLFFKQAQVKQAFNDTCLQINTERKNRALVCIYFFKQKQFQKALLLTSLIFITVGLSDFISVNAFKEVFLRFRPSHNLDIQDNLHYVNNYRGGMYGFVSSHAANMFSFATFSALILRKRHITIIVFLWAIIVCYSRIYLGVHYPADIIGGAFLGAIIAFIIFKIQRAIVN